MTKTNDGSDFLHTKVIAYIALTVKWCLLYGYFRDSDPNDPKLVLFQG